MQVHRIQNNNYNMSFGINSKQIPFTQLLEESKKIYTDPFLQCFTKSGCKDEFLVKGENLASPNIDSGNVDLQASIFELQKNYREHIIQQELLNRPRESANQILRMGIGW